jgi:alpha-beta hydrolase superfamily lysophospholipase
MITSADGTELYLRIWESKAKTRGGVVIVHGHGEHIGRYSHVADALTQRGFKCWGYDWRGHGRSSGRKGHINKWAEYRQDLQTVVDHMRNENSTLPFFILAQSVGGVTALEYALHFSQQIQGLIASAPALGDPNIPRFLFIISRLLSRIYPTFTVSSQLETHAISRDPAIVEAYEQDPLVHDLGSMRLGQELIKTTAWVQEQADQWSLPILIIHGEKDRIINPADSRRFFENIPIEDKTYLELKDGYHEPHNDLDKGFAIQRIGDWIEAHL